MPSSRSAGTPIANPRSPQTTPARGTVSISSAWSQMMMLRPCQEIAQPAAIEATMNAAEYAKNKAEYEELHDLLIARGYLPPRVAKK